MIKKRKSVSKKLVTRKRNPDSVLELFKIVYTSKDKLKKRKAALELRKLLSDDSTRYWQIIREHVNLRKDDINRIVNQALDLSKKKNPISIMETGDDIVIKHKGNKIIFDGEDAADLKEVIRREYSDNSEIRKILV